MLLSIIVPVYNGEKNIERCLKSLSCIKANDIEIIIVNDGSSDCTECICEKYQAQDDRICIITKENEGVSSARNRGLKCCRGEYVTFVDSDDEVLNEYNTIVQTLRSVKCDLYAFDYLKKGTNQVIRKSRVLWKPGINSKHALLNNYLSSNSNNVWSNIYKYDIICKNNIQFLTNMKMGEDSVFNSQYFQHCQEVYYINVVGYKYYTDDFGSASNANKAVYLKDFAVIHEKYMEIYNSEAGLEYLFKGNYYLKNVFNILKTDRKNIKKSERKEFRNSHFFHVLMAYKFRGWKRTIKKWIIRFYMYLP